MRSRRRTNCFL